MHNILKGILVVITFSISLFLISLYASCMFEDTIFSNCSVKAASYEDIIKDIQFNNINPNYLIINRTTGLENQPIIHFSLEGEAANYILHLNSVKLDKDETFIPINLNISLKQFLDILYSDKETFSGKINIRYLNDYFSKEYNIEFSKLYLINQFLNSVGLSELVEISDETKSQKINEIITMLESKIGTSTSIGNIEVPQNITPEEPQNEPLPDTTNLSEE